MSLMNVPIPGDRVVVASSTRVYTDSSFSGTQEVAEGTSVVVVGVTASVVGEGRYVKVKLAGDVVGYIHESNLNNV